LNADGAVSTLRVVSDRRGPLCPNCGSHLTERLPFAKGENKVSPIYTCDVCGHVWREPTAGASHDKRDKIA